MASSTNAGRSWRLGRTARDIALTWGCWWVATSAFAQEAPRFVDVTERVGVACGGGVVAWGDVDGDGWCDLVSDHWWRNDAGATFTRMSEARPGVVGDVDGDGSLDLFDLGRQVMLRQDPPGHFVEVPFPTFQAVPCLGAILGDLDGNGRLDVYAGGYEQWEPAATYPDRLFLQKTDGSWAIHSEDDRRRARGVTSADFDEDGDLDVYVTHYRLQPNALFRNDAGVLTDVAAEFGVLATDDGFGGGHGIGSCFADFDGDGHLDLFAGNFAHRDSRGNQPQSQFLRNGGPDGEFHFEHRGTCGVPYQESYASPVAGDFDLDGDIDLYFTTVYGTASFGVPNHPVLLRNDGEWTFTDATEGSGLQALPPTYQASWADYDRDGDLDVLTAGRLFENQTENAHWLQVVLAPPDAMPTPFGAQIRVRYGGRTRVAQIVSGVGQGNQCEAVAAFGFGEDDADVALEVRYAGEVWLDWTSVAVDQRLYVGPTGLVADPSSKEQPK